MHGLKEEAGEPRNAQVHKKPKLASEHLAQASLFSLERECSKSIGQNQCFTCSSDLYLAWAR